MPARLDLHRILMKLAGVKFVNCWHNIFSNLLNQLSQHNWQQRHTRLRAWKRPTGRASHYWFPRRPSCSMSSRAAICSACQDIFHLKKITFLLLVLVQLPHPHARNNTQLRDPLQYLAKIKSLATSIGMIRLHFFVCFFISTDLSNPSYQLFFFRRGGTVNQLVHLLNLLLLLPNDKKKERKKERKNEKEIWSTWF